MNIIRLIGLMLLVIIFLMLLIIVNLRKTDESQKSILMRIMTNYLQVITAMLSFNISFPNIINELFLPAEKIGSTSTPFVSFDCFIRDGELTLFTPSPEFLKVFLSGVLPILFFFLSIIIWGILYFVAHKW
jgi:hypothetical protein